MSTKKTQKPKAPKIPPPPPGWEIVSKDDPRLKNLPCRPMAYNAGKKQWHQSLYGRGADATTVIGITYALPIAQPAAPMIRLRLPSEKPTKEDADKMGDIILFEEGGTFAYDPWHLSFSKEVIAWLPGRLPEGFLPKPPTQEELWRKEFEEWWNKEGNYSDYDGAKNLMWDAFLAAKKSAKP